MELIRNDLITEFFACSVELIYMFRALIKLLRAGTFIVDFISLAPNMSIV